MNKLIVSLFLFLSILIGMDYLTTYYALSFLNAIELNPLYQLCNINIFFIIKTLITGTGLVGILYFMKKHQTTVLTSLIILNMLYLSIIISNLYQLYTVICN